MTVPTTDRRRAAVRDTIERLRAALPAGPLARERLEAAKPLLIDLAARTELFPPEHFPIAPGQPGAVYHLAEDDDGGFAMYLSTALPGKSQPPHNHTTWAMISGVRGHEHNIVYRRTDSGETPGRGTLEKIGELTVQRGNAIAFMPNDFHTIQNAGESANMHVHCYGHTLEDLPLRIRFESAQGGEHKQFRAKPEILSPLVAAGELAQMLEDGGELALLDVREEGVFATGHLFHAVPLPLSRLELKLDRLVPRRSTRIVLCDDGDALAQRAAAKLRGFGYRDVSILAGGVAAWRALGRELFAGVHVPSKAFGEHVEHRDGTPSITPEELAAMQAGGEKMVVLDSRPLSEFQRMSLPGAVDCPGAELVHRIFEVAPDPDTLVVVNCAGRTRSIIGAQSLRNAGAPHRVVALRNGTMGWTLAGFELERGKRGAAPAPGAAALEKARTAARRVAERFGVRYASADDLHRWESESDRTLYVLDVRTPEEFLAGHLPRVRSAPGGQLVQATDAYVGVRNARIVLVDAEDVRAVMTASWLAQMGWRDVFVWREAMSGAKLVAGPVPEDVLGLVGAAAPSVSPAELTALLDREQAIVVDLATSLEHRRGHIPGAWFAVRARLAQALPKLERSRALVLASPDGVLARLAAAEAAALWETPVSVLDGGTAAWSAAGLALDEGSERMLDEAPDVYHLPYDNAGGVEKAMRDYLTWEVALVEQLAREGVRYPEFPASASV